MKKNFFLILSLFLITQFLITQPGFAAVVGLDYMEYSTDALAQAAYATNSFSATGGTVTTVGSDEVHTFTSSGTFVVTGSGNAQVLVVGGGGGCTGGQDNNAYGGGAGKFVYNDSFSVSTGVYSVVVGVGGGKSVNGGASSFSSITADGGLANGSGGAGGTSGNGYTGGANCGCRYGSAGGGGGGSAGNGGGAFCSGDFDVGGAAGAGTANSITGASVTYACGGAGGTEGGGSHIRGTPGTRVYGDGGTGAGDDAGYLAALNGVVIIRFTPAVTTNYLQSYSESTIKTQGSYSLKGVATTEALNYTLTRTVSPTIDLTGESQINFDIRTSRTGSNIKIGIHDGGGATMEITPNVTSADTWQTVNWDISGVSNANKDAIDKIIITITTADEANTFYIDNLHTSDGITTTTTVPSTTSISSSSTTSTGGTSTTTSTTTSSSSTSSSTTSQSSTTTTSIKLKKKAIIVAGGGPEQPMWGAIKNMAEYAFRTLKFQGFSAQNIYYLSAAGSDEWSADYDGESTKDNLEDAIKVWASDADELIVYLTDHGDTGTFRMSEEEILEAGELDSWLDSINAGKTIVFIYEACKSGSFLPLLKPSPGQQRIVMTSVSANEKVRIDPYGLVSFSQYFWAGVLRGTNVCDAFTGGQDSITFQTALLDANGDGKYDPKVDCELVDDYIIGLGYGTLDDRPTINSICGEQSLTNETTASIWVDNIVSTGEIVMVWGLVDEPESAGGVETGNDIVTLPFVTLDQKSAGSTRYEGEYSGFTLQGTYKIAIYARDDSGNISMPTITRVTRSGASMTTTIPHGVTTTTTTLTIPVTVDFMGSPPSGSAPLAVEFFNLSKGEISKYEWNFGDDSKTSNEENPIHTYTKAGTYDVWLTVTGADGSKKDKVKEDHIEVVPGGTLTTTTSTPKTTTSSTTTTSIGDSCPSDYPIDCTEQGFFGCCPADYPYCGLIKCYESPPGCPMTVLSDSDEETLSTLRIFRDKILLNTQTGREYVRLYYKHASEVTSILIANPEIILQAERALKMLLPEIESIMQGKKAAIKDGTLSQINEVLDKISSNAGAELRYDIETVKQDIHRGKIIKALELK